LLPACSKSAEQPSEREKLLTAKQAVVAEANMDYRTIERLVTEAAAEKVTPEQWELMRRRAASANTPPMVFGKARQRGTSLAVDWTRRSLVAGVMRRHGGTMTLTSRKDSPVVDFAIVSSSGRRSAGKVTLRAEDGLWRLYSISIGGKLLDYSPKGIAGRLRV